MRMVLGRKAADLSLLVHGALGLEALGHEAVSAVFPLRHEGWAGGNNLQQPSEEEEGVANRDEGMGEEKGVWGSDYGYIESPAAVKIRSGSVYGWISKCIHHHHHHSMARRAKYAGHAKCAEQGAQRLRASTMILWQGVLNTQGMRNVLSRARIVYRRAS